MIRPPLLRLAPAAALRRHREAIAGAALALAGGWLVLRGGLFYAGLGLVVAAAGAGLVWDGLRRLRFGQKGAAPGIVELLEGQIAYLGPGYGGHAALSELVEIRLVELHGRRAWRLAQEGGPPLFIPVEAAGAERLYDVFAALPGLEMSAILAALAAPGAPDRLLWRRAAPQLLPPA